MVAGVFAESMTPDGRGRGVESTRNITIPNRVAGMLTYEDVRFTDELIAEIAALVARASGEAVLSHVQSHSELSRGFQLKKTNCPSFRKKIRQQILARTLSHMIARLVRPYSTCSATIVFDGHDPTREHYADNVTIIYSGGGENDKHRADRRIGEVLDWRQYTGGTGPVYVVTADNGLGREVRESGAEVMSLEQFGCVLTERSMGA